MKFREPTPPRAQPNLRRRYDATEEGGATDEVADLATAEGDALVPDVVGSGLEGACSW